LGRGDVQVLLDGTPVTMPPGNRSLSGIRSYLEALALEQQRVLCSFTVDGEALSPETDPVEVPSYSRIEGATFDLEEWPLELVCTAREQARQALHQVQSGVVLVLINNGQLAREWLWSLTKLLKEPLLTLNLLPEKLWGRSYNNVSVTRLRKWQLQQLGGIIRELDQAAWEDDSQMLAQALETRALPWLENLLAFFDLWYETLQGERSVLTGLGEPPRP
jgi:hypothetical protein